jgi:hypothetical protein
MRSLVRFIPLVTLLVATTGYCQSAFGQRILAEDTQRLVRICGAVAVGDGFTPVTNLTLSGADEAEALREGTATLDISGATWAAITGADGCYSLTLSTTATSTVGELVILIQDDSLILPIWETFQVVEEAVFDACCIASAAPITPASILAADVSDNDDVADSVGERLSRIPNAAPNASGGIVTFGTGTGQLNPSSGAVPVSSIGADVITANAIATDAIGAAEIAAGAIAAAEIATDAIDADAIAASAIGASELATGAITTAEFAAGAIDAAAIASDAIGAAEVAVGAIAADAFAAGAIDAAAIAADAIGASEIAANALTTAEIATGAISSDEIADNAIDAASTAADFSAESQDANVETINDVEIVGDGSSGDKFAGNP